MKIYFSASQRGKDKFNEYYQAIAHSIRNSAQYKLLHDELLSDLSSKEFYDKLTKGGLLAHKALVDNNLRNINAADINIFDSSVPSLSVGFMIQKSLNMNKPTIVLYLDGLQPYFIEGIESEHLIIKNYTKETIDQVLQEAISEAKQKSDKRFNFFINPQLLDYLETISRQQRISKSTFIRGLIEEHRRKQAR